MSGGAQEVSTFSLFSSRFFSTFFSVGVFCDATAQSWWVLIRLWTSAGNYLEGTMGLERMTQRFCRVHLTLVTVSEEAVARDVGTMRLGLYKSALGPRGTSALILTGIWLLC